MADSMKVWTPLWNTILESSVWGESKDVKIMWITFLAKKDKNGIVNSTISGMQRASGLTLDEARVAIAVLESPDQIKEDKEFEGRRVKKIQDGWLVLKHEHYRDMIQEEQRRQYNADKQREYRQKKAKSTSRGTPIIGEQGNVELEKNGATPAEQDRHTESLLPDEPTATGSKQPDYADGPEGEDR